MRAPPEVLPPPAIVAVRDCPYVIEHHQARQPLLDSLSKAKLWHRLGKRHPAMTRAQLIDRCHAVWRMREIFDNEKWSDRDVALQVVFLNSFILAGLGMKTTTAAEKKDLVNFYRERAKQLRDAAAWLIECPQNDMEAEEHGQAVERAAAWCEKEADEMDDKDPNQTFYDNTLVVGRQRGSPRLRAYCIKLAELMHLLYGNTLYGTVASIVSVALNCSVTKQQVIDWTRGVKAS
jgi:hypothetical protein